MKYDKVAYVCDGKGCKQMCAETMSKEEWAHYCCHHTEDESHAANKVRRNRKFQVTDGKAFEVFEYDMRK